MSTAPLPPVLRPENPPARALTELAARFDLEVHGDATGVTVHGVTLATADLRPGEVFVGIAGARRHGAEFAEQARDAGAVALITDSAGAEIASGTGLPILVADDPRALLGHLSAWLYGTDGDMPLLFGTTGTNGKTSVSHVLEGILGQLGLVTGLSSTAERHIAGRTIVSRLTTPESSELHALLALMRERSVEAVAIEVSAQALSRHRVDGLMFDVAGFTNLTHDHLDDYGDMATYFEAKLALFRPDRARRGVVCVDTVSGLDVVRRSGIPVVTVGTPEIAENGDAASADWIVTIHEQTLRGTTFTVRAPDGAALTTSIGVIGPHMAANAGLAIAMLVEAGIPFERIVDALTRDGRIDANLPGRTELVSGERGPAVYVDFSHTPDSFEKTLAAVRRLTPGRVVMMFGASGNRDALKRPAMGRIAAEGADIVIVTDHHPRYEDPATIRAALLAGARKADSNAEIHEIAGRAEGRLERRDPRDRRSGGGDPRRGRDGRRRRLRPVGGSRSSGLSRDRRRAHAVLRPGTRATGAHGGRLALSAPGPSARDGPRA